MNLYKCSKCKQIIERDSEKKWIPSYCSKTGLKTRIYKLKDHEKSK